MYDVRCGVVCSLGRVGYLADAGVTAKLNAAVNKLAKEKPADPMAFLIAELGK